MSQDVPLNDPKRERAAILLAEGDKNSQEIAAELGISRKTMTRWQSDALFSARVDYLKVANSDQLQQDGLRRKDNRLARYQDLESRIMVIVRERAAAMSGESGECDTNGNPTPKYPGGASGLLARSWDKFGNEVLKFDSALVAQFLNVQKQAAIELGQWTEKQEVTDLRNVTPEINVFIEQPATKESKA